MELGVILYNPENLDLPDFEDPSLTEYIWEYSVGNFTHVLAYDSDEFDDVPEVELNFETPFHYEADFHLLMWPEPSWERRESDLSFYLDELDPDNPSFKETCLEIEGILGSTQKLDELLPNWVAAAEDERCNRIVFVRWSNVRYEWKIRAFQGLTLDHLKANLKDLEFTKGFSLTWDDGLLLETFEEEPQSEMVFESLRYEDAEAGAKLLLAAYAIDSNPTTAKEAALYLHRFGGPELAHFHFPTLDLCKFCGEAAHSEGSAVCASRLHTLRF